MVVGLLQRGHELLKQLALAEGGQARHVLHRDHVGLRFRYQASELGEKLPLAVSAVLAVGGERLARRAAHQNARLAFGEQLVDFSAVQIGNIALDEPAVVVAFIGVAAGGVNVDAGAEVESLLQEAVA